MKQKNLIYLQAQILIVQFMRKEEVKIYKQNHPIYQMMKLKLLMGKSFARSLRKNDIDLTPEQLQVLGVILEEEACAMQKIAEEMLVDNSAVTRIIDTLEKKEFVSRTTSEKDRRVRLIAITPRGEKEVVASLELSKYYRSALLEGITEQDVENFMKILQKMRENVECCMREEEK